MPAAVGCFPAAKALDKQFGDRGWFRFLRNVWALLVFLLSVSLLLGATYNPFIYFRF